MNHGLILPILLPLFTGSALLLMRGASLPVQRGLSLLASWALLPLAIWLALLAGDGELRLYVLGDWQPPFGIVLLLDRLSAVMLIITALLAGFSVLYASRGDDERGADFHALFQFQLVGINGAFLTGDLFNLFVFFEILLISSYALLLHGQGPDRVRAGLHYVVLNLEQGMEIRAGHSAGRSSPRHSVTSTCRSLATSNWRPPCSSISACT